MSDSNKTVSIFNRLPLSTKIVAAVLVFGAVAVIATTLTVGSELKKTMFQQFEKSQSTITAFTAESAAGALRWKKDKEVENAVKGLIDNEAKPTDSIVATDASGEPVYVHNHDDSALSSEALLGLIKSHLPLETGETKVIGQQGDNLIVLSAAGMHKKKKTPHGFVAIAWRTQALTADVLAKQYSLAMMLVVAFVLLAGAIVMSVSFMVSKPLSRTIERIAGLTEGDTQSEIPFLNRADEIGKLASALSNLNQREIERVALEAQKAEDVKRREARQERNERLISEFRSTIGDLVENVEGQMGEMRTTAGSLSDVATQTTTKTQTVAQSSNEASLNIQAVSSAAEELSMSIREIGHQVQGSTEIITDADRQARESAEKMSHLSEVSQKIGDVVELILSIAEKTNLLALNATIESARAGEAGKGFAVVANEVKGLATQTAKATDEISAQIGQIQSATQEAQDQITQVVDIIARVSETSQSIVAAVEQQSVATDEITSNISVVSENALAVVRTMGEVSESVEDAETASGSVERASDEVGSRIKQIGDEVDRFSENIAAA